MYTKKNEKSTNLINTSIKEYGYNNITNNASSDYSIPGKELTELGTNFLNDIVNQINEDMTSHFHSIFDGKCNVCK